MAPISGNSFVGPDHIFEGTITGDGNLRVAGHVKGTLAVEGDVTIEPGAVVDGEVKAASVTVAPGAHMRGSVEFGWTRGAAE
jgi:cytoskeletal protein CcmA (bactofilin family)